MKILLVEYFFFITPSKWYYNLEYRSTHLLGRKYGRYTLNTLKHKTRNCNYFYLISTVLIVIHLDSCNDSNKKVFYCDKKVLICHFRDLVETRYFVSGPEMDKRKLSIKLLFRIFRCFLRQYKIITGKKNKF